MKRLAVLVLGLSFVGCSGSRGGSGAASCPTGHSVELGLQEEVDKLAGCPTLPGIVIRTGATIDVGPLKELEEITGDLTIGPTIGLDEVALNNLLRVTGTIRVANNASLRGLFFPRVDRIGRIEVENNVALMSISAPRLTTVDGAVVLIDNAELELVSAPLLATVGKELVIAGHAKLTVLEVAHLTSVEATRIEANPKLPADVVQTLTSKSALNQPKSP
jgi:hypothetical protein